MRVVGYRRDARHGKLYVIRCDFCHKRFHFRMDRITAKCRHCGAYGDIPTMRRELADASRAMTRND